MEKKYFIAYHSFLKSIEPLNDTERGRLFTALLVYSSTGEVPELRGNERFIFPMMREQIDRDAKKYAEKCQKNKENALRMHANAYERMRTHANDKEKDKEKEKENDNTPYNPPEGDVGELFDRFWNAYPKKKAKGQALTAFKKLRPDGGTVDKMLAALEWQVKTEEWRKDGGQYIPYPATWLNGRRWEDAPDIHVGTIHKLGGQVIADRAEPSGKDIFAKPAARERRLKRK